MIKCLRLREEFNLLVCSSCKKEYDTQTPRWRCDCGNYLQVRAPAVFPKKEISKRPATLWRYREALPVREPLTLGEGFTPLEKINWKGQEIMVKLDFLQPTGSYKDRGSTVMISKIREWQIEKIVEDSSGNAGASIAAYSAKAGINCDIYIPTSTSQGKALQISMYGARLIAVPGSREATTSEAIKAGLFSFYASHNWSPYFLEGTKTLAFEIWEQLQWGVPRSVIVPVGNGSLVLGLFLGFQQLKEAGEINSLPRILAVQAEACAPLAQAFRKGLKDIQSIDKHSTIAEGIASAAPVKAGDILQAVRNTNGVITTVNDQEIWEALKLLASMGIYVEPTAAVAPAAIIKLADAGWISGNDQVVVELTGSGLKATDKILNWQQKNKKVVN